MEDYQIRAVEERERLDSNIRKLVEFIFSDKFKSVEKEERERMERQLYTMMDYSRCLLDRIVNFKPVAIDQL